VEQPPNFVELQNTFHARTLGIAYRDLLSAGVVGVGDLAVVQNHLGASMSVDVAAGIGWVAGSDDVLVPITQPLYRCRNDGVVNLAIGAADATKPRVDRVIAHVYDSQFAGALDKWALEVLPGVATVGATDVNLLGAAAVPTSCLELARVNVPAAAGSIVNANIVDYRRGARVGAGSALSAITARKRTAAIAQNTVTETDLLNGEFTIPGGSLGSKGVARLTMWGDCLFTSGASQNLPRFRVKYGPSPNTILDTGTVTNALGTSAAVGTWKATFEWVVCGTQSFFFLRLELAPPVGNASSAGLFTTGQGTYQWIQGGTTGRAIATGGIFTGIIPDVDRQLFFTVVNGSATNTFVELRGADLELSAAL
jgi:hypothetical protein